MIADLRPLLQKPSGTVILIVMDGLGGYAEPGRPTELDAADTPNLDELAAQGSLGLGEPVAPGITPGSGPGHLALFGYDPLEIELGRGALSAAGLDFELRQGDVAARGNLCHLAEDGNVDDRRAGRIRDEEAVPLIERLDHSVDVEGCEVHFRHERGHRFLLVIRGEDLDPRISDTDPQRAGVPPRDPEPLDPGAERAAHMVREISEAAREELAGEEANGIILRGFDTLRDLDRFAERYGLDAAALADYPMYRGVARLVGMEVLPKTGDLNGRVELLRESWEGHDFFFFHHKGTDTAGEDGDRERKIAEIEAVDAIVPEVVELGPEVIAVSGDHATPPQMQAHSWHPVPIVLYGERVGADAEQRFTEAACARGAFCIRAAHALDAGALGGRERAA